MQCAECQMFLDENCTCFVRDGKTYCRKVRAGWVMGTSHEHWRKSWKRSFVKFSQVTMLTKALVIFAFESQFHLFLG